MTSDNLSVAGIRFRTQTDYEAALRDQEKIDRIKSEMDLNNPEQVNELYRELLSGSFRFETIIGTRFDDEIYEKIEHFKAVSKQEIKEEQSRKREAKKANREKKQIKQNKSGKTDKADKLKDTNIDIDKQALLELQRLEKRRRLLIILASIVAAASIGYVCIYYFYYTRTNLDYEQLASLKGSEALAETTEKNSFSLHKSAVKLPDILTEYQTLYAKNKKLIGWLKIDDTNIDYPVMQTSDNKYYLEHNYNQEYDKNGSIFLDCNCVAYPRSTNMIVYGHHMKSGTMFGSLQKYAKESYAKKHEMITFDTIYEKATYQVMYVFRSQVFNNDEIVFKYYQFINANSAEDFQYYMDEMKAISLFDTEVTASYGDSLLTLSTCDSSQEDGRFVVVAKRIN